MDFIKGKKYYEGKLDSDLVFVEKDLRGAFVFKVLNHKEWDELETKVPDDIYLTKKDYLKDNKNQELQSLD